MILTRIVKFIVRKRLSQPYRSFRSDIGFKAIGRSSSLRTLRLTEGRTYIPSAYSVDNEGGYTDFLITIDGGKIIRVVKSDINTLFKVVPFVRLSVMNDETDELLI